MTRVPAAILVALAGLLPAAAQEADDDALRAVERALRPAEGLEARLWARTPLLRNPTSMDVDERGRIWVSEAVNYRRFNAGPDAPAARPAGDRIVILEDADGDGRADRSKVFVEDADLVAPLGVAVLADRVVVSCSPHLLVYTRDADDRVVRKERLLTGWGGLDHDHALHRFEAGPDGRWYGNAGNAGPHVVTDRSGWTLRAGSWYTGGSPHNGRNTPGLRSDDGRIYTGGVLVRVEPDGTGLRVLGHGYRNPYGSCVDSFGDLWINDNDDTQSCRTGWQQRHGDAGYNSKDGSRGWQADRRPGQPIPAAHWRQDDPGVIPSGHVYGNGAPTGICYYENGALGEAFSGGLLLSCEAGQNVVWGYRRRPEGAGFRMEGFPFLTSTGVQDPNYVWSRKESDPRLWFRPSAVAVGTDGAVYVADWFDPVVGGHQAKDRTASGAIYRIAPKGFPARPPAYDPATPEGRLALLTSPAPSVRHRGYLGLVAEGKAAEPGLRRLLERPDRFLRARAIWVLARIGADVRPLLSDGDPEIRIVVLRSLEQADPAAALAAAEVLAADPSPAVRREAALALRDAPREKRLGPLAAVAERHPEGDRWSLEALGTGAEGLERELYEALLPRMGGAPASWTARFAGIAWRLHPAAAVPAFRERAAAPSLPPEARRQAIDALAFVPERAAAVAMKEVAEHGPVDLRSYAAWWIRHRATNDWKDFGVRPDPGIGGIAFPGAPRFASPVLRRGSVDVELDIRGARRLYLVAEDGEDGNSCDWADWLDPVVQRRDEGGALREARLSERVWLQAATGWGETHVGRNCAGRPLQVEGRAYPAGVGTHARSVLVYDVEGFETFRARAGVDDGDPERGGARHRSGAASVRFLVYHDGPSEAEKAGALRERLLDAARPAGERRQAAVALARTAEGGRTLLSLALEDRLPADVRGPVAEEIRRNPDLSVRALAGRYFPRTAASGRPYPSIEELLKLEGNAEAGRKVFLSPQAACAACHRAGGPGGEVGPDLGAIGGKFDRRGLFDAILNPSAAILVGYEGHLFALESGEAVTGFVQAEDAASVTVRTVEGPPRVLPKARIARRRPLELSLMPDNAALGIEPRQLADLVAFLQGLGRKE